MSGRTLNGLSSLANDVLGSCLIKQNNLIDLSDKPLACVNLGFTGNIPSVYKNATINATPNTLVAYDENGKITSSSLSVIMPNFASIETILGVGGDTNINGYAGISLNGSGPNSSVISIYSTSDIYGPGNFVVNNDTTQKVLFMSDPSGNFKICPTGTLGMLDNANMTITSPVIMNSSLSVDSIQCKTTSGKITYNSPILMDSTTRTIYCNSFNTYENRNTQLDATYNIDFNNNLLINIATLTSGTVKTNSITTTLPGGTNISFNSKNLTSVGTIGCTTLTGSTSVSTPSITTTGSSISFNTKSLTNVGSLACTVNGTVSGANIWRTIWNQQSTQMIAPTTYTASSSATSIDRIRFSATFTYYREAKCVYQAVFNNLLTPMFIVMEIYSIVLAPLSVSATPLLSAQTFVPDTGGSRSIVIPITSGVFLQPGQQYIVVFKDRNNPNAGLNYSVIGAEIVLGSG